RVLERAGFECVTVRDGSVAHAAAVEWRPDIILLDLMLGETTGDQIMAELRDDFRTRLIPVVFLTVRDSHKDKVEHLLSGADDYGFLRGDDVIKTLATIILEVLEENHSQYHFAGHVGGDDFVILTEPSLAETVAAEITRRFDDAIPALYDPSDRDRGWIESE